MPAFALKAVPSPAGKEVKSDPSPTNLVAVIIPVELILWELILLWVWIPGPVNVVSYVNGIILFDYL